MKKKKCLAILLSLGVVMLLTASCAYKEIKHGTEITEEELSKIINGQTTKEDVFIWFGDPSKTMNDEKVFFYTWTRGHKSMLLGLGGGHAFTHSLVIVFDDNGIVKKHKITRGTTKAATGVVD